MTTRELPPFLYAPVHGSDEPIPCIVCTTTAIHTIALSEGHFAAMVQHRPGRPYGFISILDREEVEAQILLLRNAIADAELLDAGKPPFHSAQLLAQKLNLRRD
jgi:hypothetical protein